MPRKPKDVSVALDDGIVRADNLRYETCPVCDQDVRCLTITRLSLPNGIEPSSRLIFCDSQGKYLQSIGLVCGCYARAHRQLAHVNDQRIFKGRVGSPRPA